MGAMSLVTSAGVVGGCSVWQRPVSDLPPRVERQNRRKPVSRELGSSKSCRVLEYVLAAGAGVGVGDSGGVKEVEMAVFQETNRDHMTGAGLALLLKRTCRVTDEQQTDMRSNLR